MTKYISITGGLTSRLTVLGSLLANDFHKEYKLIWDYQEGCMCKFHDIFTNDIEFVDSKDIDFNDLTIQTCGSPKDCHAANSYVVPEDYDRAKILEGYSIAGHTDFIIMDWPVYHEQEYYGHNHKWFRELVDTLQTKPEIQAVIDKYVAQYTDNMICVYFDGCEDSVNILHSAPPISRVMQIIQKSLFETEEKVLVITGSKELLNVIHKIDSDRVLLIEEPAFIVDAGYSVSGMQRSWIDWVLLSKVKKAYIRPRGYSLKACVYGNVQYETY